MYSDKKKLNENAARALMSLIRITEALEDDGCIISADGSVSAALMTEIFAAAAAKALQSGCDDKAIGKAVFSVVYIRDEDNRQSLLSAVKDGAEMIRDCVEEPVVLRILKEFDEKLLKRDRDFYKKRGGADIGLADMYEETVRAITTIMLEG